MASQTIRVWFNAGAAVREVATRVDRTSPGVFAWEQNDRLQALIDSDCDIVLVELRKNFDEEAVTHIHRHYPDVPMIVVAGDKASAQRGLAAGAADYVLSEELTAPLLERALCYGVERQRLLRELARRQRFTDPLTGLPNRCLFQDRLQQAQALADRNNHLTAVLFLDLDGFKDVNDSLGHAAGDGLLQLVAERLRGCVRETDTVARFGGDEFTILLTALETPAGAGIVARKILDALAKPVPINGQSVRVTSSIGISLYPKDGMDAETLIHKADVAMYAAKAAGQNTYRFSDGGQNVHPSASRRRLERIHSSVRNSWANANVVAADV